MRVEVEVHGAGDVVVDPGAGGGGRGHLVEYRILPSLYSLREVGLVWRVGARSATAWSTKMSGTHKWLVTLGCRVR